MPDGWTTLGELSTWVLFETYTGAIAVKTGSVHRGKCVCHLIGTDDMPDPAWANSEPVREIDLPFLLMCATDKLAESDAYQHGLREGREAMRERAAQALADGIAHPDTLGGAPMAMSPSPMLAACVRALPLED